MQAPLYQQNHITIVNSTKVVLLVKRKFIYQNRFFIIVSEVAAWHVAISKICVELHGRLTKLRSLPAKSILKCFAPKPKSAEIEEAFKFNLAAGSEPDFSGPNPSKSLADYLEAIQAVKEKSENQKENRQISPELTLER